jgi:hypothetical protein
LDIQKQCLGRKDKAVIRADVPKVRELRRLTPSSWALARDWETHGEQVIERVREENPAAYFKGMLSLLPKDVSLEGHIS